MHVTVTPIFAALLGLIYLFLSLRTTAVRRKSKVSHGDGGNAELQKAIRAHGNFIEYVPITLILLSFLEMRAAGAYAIIALASLLFVGRCLHAIGVSRANPIFPFRFYGMILTFASLLVTSLWLLYSYLI